MLKRWLAAAVIGGVSLMSAATHAQPAPPPADIQANDYGNQANWLCWPGRNDACASDLTSTVIKPDGSTSVEAFHADPHAKIDCFYVYPTVSHDPGMVSDMKVKPEETNVVIQQAARLTAHCRLYAPMYRQVTLSALTWGVTHPGVTNPGNAAARQVAYNDVLAAWNYYLAHENHGRGVVLVGHSQGSGVLAVLIKSEIDGKPEQSRIVSAILMGAPVAVPVGKDVGGAFAHIPLCHAQSQTGCAIIYSSFRAATLPPPDNTRFGRVRGDGMEAACVNPAALGGGSGQPHAYFGALIANGGDHPYPWIAGKPITTPFVSVPGMLTAECVHSGPFHVLAISIVPAPAGSPRTNDIPGDIVVFGQVQKDWGLHLIDANLFEGNLVDIVGAESAAWIRTHR
jgi:hypothetical protein